MTSFFFDQVAVVEEGLDRHQLDGGHAELHQMLDDVRIGEAGEGAAQLLGDVVARGGHALHVRFVDDRVGQAWRGGRSSPQVVAGSTTTHFGMTNAESRRSGVWSPRAEPTR